MISDVFAIGDMPAWMHTVAPVLPLEPLVTTDRGA